MEIDKIYNEECISGMERIPDHTVDLIICDLPYGTTRNKWNVMIPLDKLWVQYKRILKSRGVVLLFAQPPFSAALGMSNIEWFRYEWIWNKKHATGFLNAKSHPLKLHENILVFYRKPPTYNPQMVFGKTHWVSKRKAQGIRNYGKIEQTESYKSSFRYPTDILEYKKDKDAFHPTQKPVELIRYFIRTYTNEGDLVLDNCMGSGTTAVACIQENRHFIGFEMNEEYYNKSIERIAKAKDDESKSETGDRMEQSV